MSDVLPAADKYEQCLGAAAQRLQDALEIGKVKAIGLLEVPQAIDELIKERDRLKRRISNRASQTKSR